MRSFCPLPAAILHISATITYISAATIPHPTPHLAPLNNATAPPTLAVRPTLPWWTKLRNRNLDPPAFLDIVSVADHPATPQQTYVLQELVLLPLARRIHGGAGPANGSEAIGEGGVGAVFVPVRGRALGREVAATAVAALAVAEWSFGARG